MAESFPVANTNATTSWNTKFFGPNFQQILRNALVAEKICKVDRSNSKIIYNPYSSQPTVEISTLTGTYTPTAYTTTNDTLTVGTEFKVGEHIYDFERVMQHADTMMDRMDNQSFAIKSSIDKYIVNLLCEDGTGTYTTPASGFTVAANIPVIFSNLLSKLGGYSTPIGGAYLVIEQTDMVGILQSQLASGYSYSDRALNNGFMTNYAGVDIYVVPSGTFEDATYVGTDTTSITNSGHRVFGPKGAATYAIPQDVNTRAFPVSGKTGMEVSTNGLFGFKLWNQFKALTVDITLA